MTSVVDLDKRLWELSLSPDELRDPLWEMSEPMYSFAKNRLCPMIRLVSNAVAIEEELVCPAGLSVRQIIRGWLAIICSHLVRSPRLFLFLAESIPQLAINRASIKERPSEAATQHYEQLYMLPGEGCTMLESLRDMVQTLRFHGDNSAHTGHMEETLDEMIHFSRFVCTFSHSEDDFPAA